MGWVSGCFRPPPPLHHREEGQRVYDGRYRHHEPGGTSPNPLIRSTTPGLETNKHGCIVTEGDEGKTSREGVYAGGDAVTGAATVIKAMGAGKAAAKAIDEYIQNK